MLKNKAWILNGFRRVCRAEVRRGLARRILPNLQEFGFSSWVWGLGAERCREVLRKGASPPGTPQKFRGSRRVQRGWEVTKGLVVQLSYPGA